MTEQFLFNGLIISWFIVAAVTFVILFFINAPYGRHTRRGWGPSVGNRLGWVIMEAPAVIILAAYFTSGEQANTLTTLVFFCLWEAHYIHRALIYPLGLRGENKRMPLLILSSAVLFNTVNGYLHGRYLFGFSGGYSTAWLVDIRFLVGLALFITGFVINRHADETLRNLRQPGESGYKIPHGGLYRWISCPNYLGEITEWVGWAVATWSLPGLAFAVWTTANLVPRARAHHTWYHQYFDDYPAERKALLPKVW